ncbi:recombinase family protein [Nocardioides sp. KR10-350]|uniref:recombinase family protein n=1 Tax=Nocardioides cheoyonin TaxID=3156615 RepID=UPI0032B3E175
MPTDAALLWRSSSPAAELTNRPGLRAALERLDNRKDPARALFVLDLDRLTRSVGDFALILDRAAKRGWTLTVLGLGAIDTSTPEGRMAATMIAAAGEYERAMTSKRVARQHEARRARGIVWGVDEGPRPLLPDDVRRRIANERAAGRSLRAIADGLTADGVPTARGGRWQAATVKRILESPSLSTPEPM